MKAYLYLTAPRIGGRLPELEEIVTQIRDTGILEFDRDSLRQAIEKREFGRPILIASGRPPSKGEKAKILLKVADGESAKPGQLLAIKETAGQGEQGWDVYGNQISGLPGDDVRLIIGAGVRLSEDGTRAYATMPGRVVWREDSVSVEEVKEIEGDLNIGDGPIDFSGMVIINGFVGDKVMVKAQSDIIIAGGVGDASIISGGEIKIQQAIFGKGEGRITAKGSLAAISIEGMTIEVEGDVIVDDFIQKSNIIAKRVICGGQIEGGKISAGELIEARALGSETKTKTVLRVDKGGRISGKEAVHQGVELHIDTVRLTIKSPKQGMSFELEGSRIKEGPYLKTEVENLLPPRETVKLKDLVPSVVIDSPTIDEGRARGAGLLGLTPTGIDVKVIRRDEERETVSIRVFPAGAAGPWDTKDEIDIELEGLCEAESDGYYQLANTTEGLFLTVFPPKGGWCQG